MAEEQEKNEQQKPKTTLIKHKKEQGGDEKGDKKKVRVVVKRKPKAKAAPQPEREAEEEFKSSPKAKEAPQKAEKAPEQEPKPEKRPEKAAKKEPEAPKKSAPKGEAPKPPKEETPQEEAPKKKDNLVWRPVLPGESGESPVQPAAASRKDEKGRKERAMEKRSLEDIQPQNRRVQRNETRSSAAAARSSRSAEQTQRGGGPGGGQPPQGRGTGPSRPAPTGRTGGPPRGGRPSPGAPPPSGGAGAPESGRPERGGGAGKGRKFYKSKKKESYSNKRDRQQEKELSFSRNKKSTAPKANPVPKEIDIMDVVTVSELARKMNLKASDLIGKLMNMGMMVTINQQIDAETAEILASEYGCKVNIVSLYDETVIEREEEREEDLELRPPIVTVMGHVDHGKTKLLDAIRSTDVAAGEFGGITQHIGAYQVTLPGGHGKVTFLDTPGHEAFTLMRARGAQVTDIVILVVAANDGVMPQTREAVDHAKAAGVPIIVAINKTDLPDANPDRVKQQLSDLDLMPEAWGGNTIFAEVSALKREGIEELLESIILQAEFLELKASKNVPAEGRVIESQIDPGRGAVSTVLVERGTLEVGDSFVAGIYSGKVRAMFNDRAERVDEAGPSMPVEILGCDGVPDAGDPFQVTEDEKAARQVGAKRQELKRVEEAKSVKKITLDNLYDSIEAGEVQELKVVIKGDVHGSVEAVQSALEKLSNKEVRLNAIRAAAGAINEGDVMLAAASDAIVIGFHVRPTPRAAALAEQEKVEIRKYNIIYDAVEDVRSAMEGMLAPDLQEEIIGTAEVRDTFKVPKIGVIAGSYVTDGVARRNAKVRVFRDEVQIHEGKISSLKRFKDDAKEVAAGYECGIGLENYNDLKPGDTLEFYEIKQIAKKLDEVKG
ncbi:MAG: translation initiation factor IF-2 [Spirochaetaceae bacterium]